MSKITPIEFEFTFRKQTETIYCKPWLTAGDQVRLSKGQKFTRKADEKAGSIEIDLGETVERNQLYVALMRTNADGTPYYKSLRDLQDNEPAKKIEALAKRISDEVDFEEDEGNVGSTTPSAESSPDLH